MVELLEVGDALPTGATPLPTGATPLPTGATPLPTGAMPSVAPAAARSSGASGVLFRRKPAKNEAAVRHLRPQRSASMANAQRWIRVLPRTRLLIHSRVV